MKELCEARAKLEMSSNCQIYLGKTDDELPLGKPARQQSELFSFQIYPGKTYDDPPSSTLKQKLEMVYSFTFYAALYMCCHLMYCVIWS